LARAVVRGTEGALAEYEAARDEMARGMLEITERVASFEWDLEEAKILHLDLGRQMKPEVDFDSLNPAPPSSHASRSE
jgi:hypothetical protein